MKTLLFTGWSFMRALRLVTGIAAIIFSIPGRDILLGLAGGFLLLMAVLNFGCCGVNGCSIKAKNPKIKT